MKKRIFTNEEIQKIINLFNSGITNNNIAKELKCNTTLFAKVIRNLGLKRESIIKGKTRKLIIDSKSCTTCKQILPLKNFSKNNQQISGLSTKCKNCISTIAKLHRQDPKNKTKNSIRRRKLYEKSIEKHILYGAKKRAEELGLEFNLELEDIIIPKFCPVFNIPIFPGKQTSNINSPTIDRINNNKGYTKDNIKIISQKANAMKRNASIEELEMIINYIKINIKT